MTGQQTSFVNAELEMSRDGRVHDTSPVLSNCSDGILARSIVPSSLAHSFLTLVIKKLLERRGSFDHDHVLYLAMVWELILSVNSYE